MSKRLVFLGGLMVVALALVVLAAREAAYLRQGYSIGFSIQAVAGPPLPGPFDPSSSHISFPVWRMAALAVRDLMALGVIWLLIHGRRAATPVAWTTLAAGCLIGIADVVEYGFLGSPTSSKTLGALLLLALIATFWPRPKSERPA